MGKTIWSLLVILQPDLVSCTLAWHGRPLHIHKQIMMSHNLVTEIKKTLACSTVGTRIAFQIDMTSLIAICLSIPQAMHELSTFLCRNPISVWWSGRDAICRGNSLQVQHASITWWVMNRVLYRAEETLYVCLTLALRNLDSFDYFLVTMSLAEYAIFWGWYQETS